MHVDVPGLDHKRPFYYDVINGKPFTFTSERLGVLTQIGLLLIFLKGADQLWTLEEYWMQVSVLTGHLASTADFNWRASHTSVSCWLNVCKVNVGSWYQLQLFRKIVI